MNEKQDGKPRTSTQVDLDDAEMLEALDSVTTLLDEIKERVSTKSEVEFTISITLGDESGSKTKGHVLMTGGVGEQCAAAEHFLSAIKPLALAAVLTSVMAQLQDEADKGNFSEATH